MGPIRTFCTTLHPVWYMDCCSPALRPSRPSGNTSMSLPSQDKNLPSYGSFIPAAIYAGVVLAWVGTLIALLLGGREGAVSSLLCSTRGGCETVLSSVYSEIRGIPLPVIGLIFYLVQLGLWLAVLGVSSQRLRLRLVDSILGLAVAGVTFSAGLMYVQFGVL